MILLIPGKRERPLSLAERLLEQCPDEKPEALEDLNFAINELREMEMQSSLERALKHKEILVNK